MTFATSHDWLAHKGTVGRPIMGTLHIVGEDNETELPVGEEGVVFFESENVFEYHDDPEKTASSRNSKGWSTLGDVGKVDEDGSLYLTDRKSFMIISGGVNIYPQEIENHLVTHPKVADVAVVGGPHEEMGEEVIAVIQPEFMWDHGTAYTGALGPVRTHWQYRGRSLLDAGVRIVGSSDRPVAAGSPLQAIQFMVTRRDVQGALIGDGEQITVEEGLRAYTSEAARAIGKEGRLGVLRAGAEADLVVLDADPRAVPADEIGAITVRETWVAGVSVG